MFPPGRGDPLTKQIITALMVVFALDPVPAQYQKSPLSMTLRMIAARRLDSSAKEMAELITRGLSSSDPDEREAALYVIGSRSGILMPPTPQYLPDWTAKHSTLQAFRKQVSDLIISDPHQDVRQAAVLAFAGLTLRPDNGEWRTDLDVNDVTLLAGAFRAESFGGPRADILKLIVQCNRCAQPSLQASQELVREALYDASPGIVQLALYGVRAFKLSDMLDATAALLKNPTPGVRAAAAMTLATFGRDAARHRAALQDALTEETSAEVRGSIEGALRSSE
jgi:hypothetical protein